MRAVWRHPRADGREVCAGKPLCAARGRRGGLACTARAPRCVARATRAVTTSAVRPPVSRLKRDARVNEANGSLIAAAGSRRDSRDQAGCPRVVAAT